MTEQPRYYVGSEKKTNIFSKLFKITWKICLFSLLGAVIWACLIFTIFLSDNKTEYKTEKEEMPQLETKTETKLIMLEKNCGIIKGGVTLMNKSPEVINISDYLAYCDKREAEEKAERIKIINKYEEKYHLKARITKFEDEKKNPHLYQYHDPDVGDFMRKFMDDVNTVRQQALDEAIKGQRETQETLDALYGADN